MEPSPVVDTSPCVALVGNPNSGKTTLFNSLTGSHYKVANYPGVTVEKKEGTISLDNNRNVRIIDLPGTYSLSGSTIDESIVTKFLHGTLEGTLKPDLIIAVVDATNLERNLFVVSELIDTGIPLIVALNMMDAARDKGMKIYVDLLGRLLDLPVIPISGRLKNGLTDLMRAMNQELLHPSRSRRAYDWIPADRPDAATLRGAANPCCMAAVEPPILTAIATLRYSWIRAIVSRVVSGENSVASSPPRLDALITSKMWGVPILLSLFALMFQAIFLWAQLPMDMIGSLVDGLSALTTQTFPDGILTRLVAEGIIPGVGNVLVFIPQIAILFFFIGLLEDSGYLSRAAFLLDNFMRKVGLQGRAFIPLLSSFACAVPGILSTRTIPTRADRLATILVAPLMSCSARLPVYAVLIGATVPPIALWGFVSLQGLALLAMYLLGVIGACVVASILQRVLRRKESCFFVMEMPPLRKPVLRIVLRNVYDSVSSFVRNAATIILACSVIIWFLASYPANDSLSPSERARATYAGKLGGLIEPAIKPLGFNWEIGFSIIASFPAREVFVTSLATVLNVHDDDDDQHRSLITKLQAKRDDGSFSTPIGLSLMVFYVFACQCMSTIAVCRRETGSWLWAAGMFGYMTMLAYVASFVTYNVVSTFFY